MDKSKDNYGTLTPLGHKQAKLTAKRLKEHPIEKINSSTLERAKQTTMHVVGEFPKKDIDSHLLLKEGLPYLPDSVLKEKKIGKNHVKQDRERMETAFQIFFVPFLKEGEFHEALICHGNLIRFFVCTALEVPIEAWTKFDIYECSITVIRIKQEGRISVLSVGEIGHIPVEERTFY